MYCMKCGYKNVAGQAYCINCGTKLAMVTPTDSSYRPEKGILGLTIGKKVSGTAALLALVCFFLPWITVSCGASWSLSGWDIATYDASSFSGWDIVTFDAPSYSTSEVPASRVLFAVPVAAALIIAVVILAMNRGWGVQRLTAIGEVLLSLIGGLPTLAALWQFESARRDLRSMGLGMMLIKIEPAFYLTVLAFAVVLVGGILDFTDTG